MKNVDPFPSPSHLNGIINMVFSKIKLIVDLKIEGGKKESP